MGNIKKELFSLPANAYEKPRAFSASFWFLLLSIRTAVEVEISNVLQRCLESTLQSYTDVQGIQKDVFQKIVTAYIVDLKMKIEAGLSIDKYHENRMNLNSLDQLQRIDKENEKEMLKISKQNQALMKEQRQAEEKADKARNILMKKAVKSDVVKAAIGNGTKASKKPEKRESKTEAALVKYNNFRTEVIKGLNALTQANESFRRQWVTVMENGIKSVVQTLESFFIRLTRTGTAYYARCPNRQLNPYERIIDILDNIDPKRMAEKLKTWRNNT